MTNLGSFFPLAHAYLFRAMPWISILQTQFSTLRSHYFKTALSAYSFTLPVDLTERWRICDRFFTLATISNMLNLRLLSLTAASLFAIASSSDSYVSPEKNADMVFVGAEFSNECNGTVIYDQPRAAKRRNAIATRFQVSKVYLVEFFKQTLFYEITWLFFNLKCKLVIRMCL